LGTGLHSSVTRCSKYIYITEDCKTIDREKAAEAPWQVKNRKSSGKGEKTPQNIVCVIAREGCTFFNITYHK
jgi:hypothetical protein